MTLRMRMALMIAPLLAAVGFFAFLNFSQLQLAIRDGRAAHQATLEMEAISDLIHQLQLERAISAGYVASFGVNFADEITGQYDATDAVLRAVQPTLDALGDRLPDSVAPSLSHLGELVAQRNEITDLAATVPHAVAFYTALIESLLGVKSDLVMSIRSPSLVAGAQAAAYLSSAKEASSLEGVEGAIGLGSWEFSQDIYAQFMSLRGAMGAALHGAGQALQDPQFEENTLAHESAAGVNEARGAIDLGMTLGRSPEVEAADWFDASFLWNEHLYEVEAALLSDVSAMAQALNAEARVRFWIQAGVTLAVVLAGLAMAIATFETLIRRISRVTTALQKFTAGEFDVEIPQQGQADAVGQMSAAVHDFKEHTLAMRNEAAALKERDEAMILVKAQRVVELMTDGLATLARADLTRHYATPLDPEYDSIRADFNAASERLRNVMREISRTADDLGARANAMTQSSADLQARTGQQVSTLNATSERISVLSDEVKAYAGHVQEAAEMASTAKSNVTRSGDVVVAASEAMDRIAASSREIERVLMLIDEISHQTNLLALNAGVEAARAGESGRGFSIVAAEVRDLARRSGDAAQEIKEMIGDSTANVAEGVTLVREAGSALQEISQEISSVDDVLGRLAEGSSRQSESLHDLAGEVADVNGLAAQNTQLADSSSTISQETAELSQHLNDLLSDFKLTEHAPGGHQARPAA